jgi:hypothetical protein
MRSLLVTLASVLIVGLAVGCTSQSYKAGVRVGYPPAADRIDQLSGQQTPAAANLRTAAADPITFGKASKAWHDAAPVYRTVVTAAPSLTDHRRSDWLKTADLLDKLNADEAKHESLIFVKPPATQPITAAAR